MRGLSGMAGSCSYWPTVCISMVARRLRIRRARISFELVWWAVLRSTAILSLAQTARTSAAVLAKICSHVAEASHSLPSSWCERTFWGL